MVSRAEDGVVGNKQPAPSWLLPMSGWPGPIPTNSNATAELPPTRRLRQ